MEDATTLVAISLLFLTMSASHSEPCSFNPLCVCTYSQADITCVGVPLVILPTLPTDDMYQLSVIRSELQILNNDSVKDSKLSSLRLMHNKLTIVLPRAFKGTESLLSSLDLSFNRLVDIPSLALRKLHHLQWLSLHGNHIEEINARDISTLESKPTLKNFFLGENKLLEIKDGTFSKLEALLSLDLSNNMLSEIDGKPFPNSLVTLSLSHNQLNIVPSYALSNLNNLISLQLHGNLLQDVPQFLPIPVKQIQKLDLSNNLLTTLPEHFLNASSIAYLHLEFNFLKKIKNATFNAMKIERLSLSNNLLSTISAESFWGLERDLRMLDLSYNILSNFSLCLLEFSQLTHLYLRGNFLKELNDKAFGRFSSVLEVLDLSDNLLTRIPTGALNSTKRLLHLSLQDNLINQIRMEDFSGWGQSLVTLSLASNKLTELLNDVFFHLPMLRELRLSYNSLKFLDSQFLLPIRNSLEVLEMSSTLVQQDNFPLTNLEGLLRLKWIQLDHNSFTSFNSSLFFSLPNLRYCDLEGNQLTFIDDDLSNKSPNHNINSLVLSNNDIQLITSDTFKQFPSVASLVLYNNKLTKVNEFGFRDMHFLHTVVLAHNQLTHLEPGSFHNLSHLTNVFLQDNQLTNFSLNIFNKTGDSATPMYLNLSNNKVESLIDSFDYEAEEVDLEVRTLDLSQNRIYVISEGFFRPIGKSLFNLFLSYNRLSNISLEILSDTPHLQALMLDHNQLSFIPADVFYGSPSLQIISLSHNIIQEIPQKLFSSLEKLRILDLSNNFLQEIPNNCFDNTKLEILNLSRNKIRSFPSEAFSSVVLTLTKLDFSSNYLNMMNGLNSLLHLQSLNLSSNAFSKLTNEHFEGLINLLDLDLSNNSIFKWNEKLYRPLHALRTLNLENTTISNIPILPLPNLRSLKLSKNVLSNLSDKSFMHLSNLRLLDLSRNLFEDVPYHIWRRVPNLAYLDISYNYVQILSTVSFVGLRRLTYLDIRGLRLKFLEPETLNSLKYLRILKTNSYSSVRTFPFHELLAKCSTLSRFWIEIDEPMLSHQLQWTFGVKLRELTVTGEHLTKILPDAFLGLQTHKLILRITNTSISKLPDGLLRYLADVRYLTVDLRGNRLSSMTPEVLAINKEDCVTSTSTKHVVGGVMLEDNPWICTCDLLWLGEWMRRWMKETLRIHILPIDAALQVHTVARRVVCTTKDGLIRIPIIDLRKEHLGCQNDSKCFNSCLLLVILSILINWTPLISR